MGQMRRKGLRGVKKGQGGQKGFKWVKRGVLNGSKGKRVKWVKRVIKMR